MISTATRARLDRASKLSQQGASYAEVRALLYPVTVTYTQIVDRDSRGVLRAGERIHDRQCGFLDVPHAQSWITDMRQLGRGDDFVLSTTDAYTAEESECL